MNNFIRSPFFYVGDKYKLMEQLKTLFPLDINNYIEPFCGGGSSALNIAAKRYYLNDIDSYVIKLHKFIAEFSRKPDELINQLYDIINKYNLSCSYKGITVPTELKLQFPKTYYSHYNKDAYLRMREDFNKRKDDISLLYLLLVYGFNHMIRFNALGEFNLPVGNVDFNKNVFNALVNYLSFSQANAVEFYNEDYNSFLNNFEFEKDDFVYLDPPYLISMSEYNKMWNEDREKELYRILDILDNQGINWGITNLLSHKGVSNIIFTEWSKKYNIYNIDSNYISFNDNTVKSDSKEVYVTNYVPRKRSTS